jgi:hypothetical protein
MWRIKRSAGYQCQDPELKVFVALFRTPAGNLIAYKVAPPIRAFLRRCNMSPPPAHVAFTGATTRDPIVVTGLLRVLIIVPRSAAMHEGPSLDYD